MKTRGELCADAVREYLFSNGLKQSQLTGAFLAEIINRTLDFQDNLLRKKKQLATEADWIAELEKEPHLQGVAVRKELAAAQFWCKNNARVCTRRFFVNWLNKAERSAVISPGGNGPEINRKDVYTEPPGWRASAVIPARLSVSAATWQNICATAWADLSVDLRASILRYL